MAIKPIKIKFVRDYSPRKKGETFEANTYQEIRVAEWYLANQIAERCECAEKGSGCAGCDENKEKQKEVSEVEETAKTKFAPKNKASKD